MKQTEHYESVKFTAVEWLYLQLIKNPKTPWNDILEQAKEMEKEQIVDAYRNGRSDQQSDRQSRFYNRMAKQYYNETYHIVESNEMIDHIGDANKMVCEHSYSRSMNQPYPRKCIKCKEVEEEIEKL